MSLINTITVSAAWQQIFTQPIMGYYLMYIEEQADNMCKGGVNIQTHGNVVSGYMIETVDVRGFLEFGQFLPAKFKFEDGRVYQLRKSATGQLQVSLLSGTDISVKFTIHSISDYSPVDSVTFYSQTVQLFTATNAFMDIKLELSSANTNWTANTAGTSLTNTKAGRYQISYKISYDVGTNSNSTTNNAAFRLIVNNDQVPGSGTRIQAPDINHIYNISNTIDTASLPAGSVLKLQGITSNTISGNNTPRIGGATTVFNNLGFIETTASVTITYIGV